MATQYYKRAEPLKPNYLTDEGRPTISFIMRSTQRESHVNRIIQQDKLNKLNELRDDINKDLNQRYYRFVHYFTNCINNLEKAIELKSKDDPSYMDYLIAHAYENFDLAQELF